MTPTQAMNGLFVYQGLTFYSNNMFLQPKGLIKIDKQESANVTIWKNTLLLSREDWIIDGTTYKAVFIERTIKEMA